MKRSDFTWEDVDNHREWAAQFARAELQLAGSELPGAAEQQAEAKRLKEWHNSMAARLERLLPPRKKPS